MTFNYEWALPYLPNTMTSILEVGSRDALDAIFLSDHFDCPVIAFEPNPSSFDLCKENISNRKNSRIQVRDEALSDENGIIEFGVVSEEVYDNIGASSMFEIDFINIPKSDPDYNHNSIQTKVKVKAARFDCLNLKAPELLVMDCEGAELKALTGFGGQLSAVRFVVLEVSQVSIGKGACTFKEVNSFLKKNSFVLIGNSANLSKLHLYRYLAFVSIINRIKRPIGKPLKGASFDAVYVNQSQTFL